MKSLKVIQVLAKIGRIFSKIVFICSIVGAAGCLIGALSLAVGEETVKLGGVTLHTLLKNEAGIELGTIWAAIAVGFFLCAGQIAIAKLAERYFAHELRAGTPFTSEGARELFRLGICTVSISAVAMMLAQIAQSIIALCMENVEEVSFEPSSGLTMGVTFMIVALLCRYGADMARENQIETDERR